MSIRVTILLVIQYTETASLSIRNTSDIIIYLDQHLSSIFVFKKQIVSPHVHHVTSFQLEGGTQIGRGGVPGGNWRGDGP